MKNVNSYFQGGGGENEPTPKKPKYKKELLDPKDVIPRRIFFKNYDLYLTEGVNGDPEITPGKGFYNSMNDYESVSDFRKKKRKEMMERRKAFFWILTMTKTAENSKDHNLLDFPTDETVTPIPWNPAETSPLGMFDGIMPSSDEEGKTNANLMYGIVETHYADDKK